MAGDGLLEPKMVNLSHKDNENKSHIIREKGDIPFCLTLGNKGFPRVLTELAVHEGFQRNISSIGLSYIHGMYRSDSSTTTLLYSSRRSTGERDGGETILM